jgi:hypothetical protein
VKISKNNGTWFDLTVHNLEKPATGGNIAINNALQTNAAFPEKTDAKTMIGGNPTTDSTPNSSFSRHQQSNDSTFGNRSCYQY